MADFAPTHPGEILAEEFLVPMGISAYRLAQEIGVPQTRLSEIIHGRRAITADTGLRLSRALGGLAEALRGDRAPIRVHLLDTSRGVAETDPAVRTVTTQ